ncbi:MerR family transcriptional regulator [Hoeflea sp. WL0058]|uniref:MerR family transcriptional regulator n=1 Tax=Flavimaribacter sediminis TaxID=2865987 RepID=A0AAE2ZQ24_9HYPH|nr:MerR family transcriptional regulator [Flavimaribacter sediminis]MBW8639929.1 MerR family transcriptional regulator [Flavimaribacter sediminis]
MRIGELAKRTGLSRDSIRFYEKNGLIRSDPGDEPSNNYRDYPEDLLPTLEMIAEAQAAGFTISELRRFMAQLDAASIHDFDGEAFLQGKIEEVERNIIRSKRFLETLKAAKSALAIGGVDDTDPD